MFSYLYLDLKSNTNYIKYLALEISMIFRIMFFQETRCSFFNYEINVINEIIV